MTNLGPFSGSLQTPMLSILPEVN